MTQRVGERKETYLVHHHDREQVANRREEEGVEVVTGVLANSGTQSIQQNLPNHQEENAKDQIA